MDRRQRKTRTAIFHAFTELLAQKSFEKMTVEEIITLADVGRATFYAHFETKEYLLKEYCRELFCHLFDNLSPEPHKHRHIFSCEEHDSVFLHLVKHLENNDNQILKLFAGQNHELFLRYFNENLYELVTANLHLFAQRKAKNLPEDLWICHIASTFTQTLRWWLEHGKQEPPETITEYFFKLV